VAVCVPVHDGDEGYLPRLLGELERVELVELDVVLADLTCAGALADAGFAGARVVRGAPGSRGGAYRAALAASDAPLWAWQLARARAPAGRLALLVRALESAPAAALATSDLVVRGEKGTERVARVQGTSLPACWETTVLMRRAALETIGTESFAPAELALARSLGAAGLTTHVPEPLALVDEALFEARDARTRQDEELLRLAESPHSGPPEVTVLLATHDRREVLLACLEGFSRQLVAPGVLEIVVCDDGSSDGTEEFAKSLALPVPFSYLREELPGGASRARIRGLERARGRLVLFVNDDTIPFPDTVARHLAAHAALAPSEVAVLGTFEQPEEHLNNALMRLLEHSNYVFGYAGFAPGQTLDGAHFYTCNTSVARAAVLAVGGFDPAFRMFAEDTDLGLRLERAGVPLVYRPECRALHHHFLSFDALRRRQRVVAQAHVRLLAKHPARLERSAGWRTLGAAEITRRNAPVLPHLATIEGAARALAGVDLTALEHAGDDLKETSERISMRLADLVGKLNRVWWDQGFLDGFAEERVPGFEAIVARSALAREVARA
jgi:GT2 family glycosyltransferase